MPKGGAGPSFYTCVKDNDAASALNLIQSHFQQQQSPAFPQTFRSHVRTHEDPVAFILDIAASIQLKECTLREQRKVLRGLGEVVGKLYLSEDWTGWMKDQMKERKDEKTKVLEELDGKNSEDQYPKRQKTERAVKRIDDDITPASTALRTTNTKRLLSLLANYTESPLLCLLIPPFGIAFNVSDHRLLGRSLFERLLAIGALAECVMLATDYGFYPYVDHRALLLQLARAEDKKSITVLLAGYTDRLITFCELMEEMCSQELKTIDHMLGSGHFVGTEHRMLLKQYAKAGSDIMAKHRIDPDANYHSVAAASRLMTVTWLLHEVDLLIFSSPNLDLAELEDYTDIFETVATAGSSKRWKTVLSKLFVGHFMRYEKTRLYGAFLSELLQVRDFYGQMTKVTVEPTPEFHSVPAHGKKMDMYLSDVPVEFVNTLEKLEVLNGLISERVVKVGIDCEWAPTALRITADTAPPAILQIALDLNDADETSPVNSAPRRICRILDLIHLPRKDLSRTLERLFTSRTILKLGFDFSHDLSLLRTIFPSLPPLAQIPRFEDLCKYPVNGNNPTKKHKNSLKKMVELILHKRLDKTVRISNWERRPLRASQLRYAANDAIVLLDLYDKYQTEKVSDVKPVNV
ncbi:uncharacterized protein SPPG_00606 [Spizellomyces punctatus DAOM BR117]|uniref:3'-5' exonuclease domain-containing protein n=1 Tax=Spizellomyces punctatus (strain DAOM BR117) TaxID=645134 RepID=A0A0L0HVI0_SPIPD|nr:uncharacterized protein SPPG_00606 [Spizellomyces punctatus DAOM BR117]KND04915.1 hypothetical protein SPPG_00606 [Spizellomyces punctatus DAOM BR117]|eukprot:XP_016612954.1 hypothetical protein SPPG_00606 [Spizellomyces punctatus DAOM BR117]